MKNKRYNDRYYQRHLFQYSTWEIKIGKHIFNTLHPSSIMDFGCGIGSFLQGALESGCKKVKGIDISYDVIEKYLVKSIRPYVHYGDVTEKIPDREKFNCVISFEVGEHIDPKRAREFIRNITHSSREYIIITAAPPKQKGTGHINLREKEFWIKRIERHNFAYQPEIVDDFVSAWKKFGTPNYILKNLMVFKILEK